VERKAVREILRRAWLSGVDMLDTAASYGQAEAVIGEMRPDDARFSMVTKCPPLADFRCDSGPVEQIVARVRQSRELLKAEILDGLLVHHAPDLLDPVGPELFRNLVQLKMEGIVRRVGVSVYDPETLAAVLDRYPIEIVQLPLNVFDQRFIKCGAVALLRCRGIEVHVRSVFLQGNLIGEGSRLPNALSPVRNRIVQFQQRARDMGHSPASAALTFVAQCEGVTRVVIGVDSEQQLEESVEAFDRALTTSFDASDFNIDDLDIVDPRRWRVDGVPS
jgi:aryl-alcohol dehydrogenase-like predicted oxidoreductase